MISGSCACTSITNPKSVGKFPLTSVQLSPASNDRITSQCFCMYSKSGRDFACAIRCTQCPTSASGSGMYCDRNPLLIGFHVFPPSSLRNAPAAEIAIKIRPAFFGSSTIVCRHIPPAPGCHFGPKWQPGAGGMCLHTIVLDPKNAGRIFIAISAAGAFRSDDEGKTWKPINKGLKSQYIPNPEAEVGHCVHRIAQAKSRPDLLYMQKHWDVMRSFDAGDSWTEVSGNLPTDFGFVIDVHAHEPEIIYVVPIKSDGEHFPLNGKLRVYRSKSGGNEWQELSKGLPEKDCYVNVLRDAMAVDSLDKCGIYFATTGGQVYCSPLVPK